VDILITELLVVAVPVDAEATIPNTDSTTVVEDIVNTDLSLLVVDLVDVVEVAKINLVIS
jgi:hypothetical protein